MSASLVGSEMCIRDSLLGLGVAARRPWGQAKGARRSTSLWQAICASSDYCLLYTSDAADDM
eukprot:10249479-Alexandrium_andersonii.AAC.1